MAETAVCDEKFLEELFDDEIVEINFIVKHLFVFHYIINKNNAILQKSNKVFHLFEIFEIKKNMKCKYGHSYM